MTRSRNREKDTAERAPPRLKKKEKGEAGETALSAGLPGHVQNDVSYGQAGGIA